MKSKIIIIGFKYQKREISCVIYDIYRVYSHFLKLGHTCHIITDVTDFTYTISMYDSILKKQVDEDFTDFIGEIKYYPTWYSKVNNLSTLKETLDKLVKCEICTIYYSGHGTTKGIQLPSNEVVDYISLRNMFIQKATRELVIILDCCKGSDMNLIYYIDNSCKTYKAFSSGEYFDLPITIIASSDSNQKSLANDYTSLFTKYFIEFLELDEHRSYGSMIEYIESNILGHGASNQNIKVYSSIARYPIIPSYFFSQYYMDINILHDYLTFYTK